MTSPAGSKDGEGRTRLLVGALVAAGLVLALFIAFVVPNLIDDEEEPSTTAGGDLSPGPTPTDTGRPGASPTSSPTTADGPSPSPQPSPTTGVGATASPAPTPGDPSDGTSATGPRKRKAAPAPAPPPAPVFVTAPPPPPPEEQVFPVAHGENGRTYAAVYVKRDGEWVMLAEAVGNDAPRVTP